MKFEKLLQFTTLLFPLVLGAVGYFTVSDQPQTRLFFLMFLCFGYILWGTVVHLVHDRARHPKVILEYILIGILGLALVSFILYHE